VVFCRVNALYLSADKSYRCLSLSVVSDDESHCILVQLCSSAPEPRGDKKCEDWKMELDKDAVCHKFCSTCTANTLTRKLWKGWET
jgi:hypothetical protein